MCPIINENDRNSLLNCLVFSVTFSSDLTVALFQFHFHTENCFSASLYTDLRSGGMTAVTNRPTRALNRINGTNICSSNQRCILIAVHSEHKV